MPCMCGIIIVNSIYPSVDIEYDMNLTEDQNLEELKNLLLSPKNLNSDLTHQFSNKKLSGDRRRSTILKLPVLRQIKLPSSQSKSSRRVSKHSDELQNKVSDKTLS